MHGSWGEGDTEGNWGSTEEEEGKATYNIHSSLLVIMLLFWCLLCHQYFVLHLFFTWVISGVLLFFLSGVTSALKWQSKAKFQNILPFRLNDMNSKWIKTTQNIPTANSKNTADGQWEKWKFPKIQSFGFRGILNPSLCRGSRREENSEQNSVKSLRCVAGEWVGTAVLAVPECFSHVTKKR